MSSNTARRVAVTAGTLGSFALAALVVLAVRWAIAADADPLDLLRRPAENGKARDSRDDRSRKPPATRAVNPAPGDRPLAVPDDGVVQGGPNLKIASVEPDGPSKMPTRVTVANVGLGPAKSYHFEIVGYNHPHKPAVMRLIVYNRSTLGGHESRTIEVPKLPTWWGKVKVDPENEVREWDERDNTWFIEHAR